MGPGRAHGRFAFDDVVPNQCALDRMIGQNSKADKVAARIATDHTPTPEHRAPCWADFALSRSLCSWYTWHHSYSPPIPSSVASDWVSGGSNYVPETDKGGARRNGLVQRVDFLGDKMPFQKRVPQNQNLCRSPRARCSAEDAKKMRPALLDSSPAYQGGPPRQAA